jgi:hypothetical protein
MLNNAGSLDYTGSGLSFGYGINQSGTWKNMGGAVFNIDGDGDILVSAGTGHGFFNAGTIRKTGGTEPSLFAVPFHLLGGIADVQYGGIRLSAGGSFASQFTIASGALYLEKGLYALADGTIGVGDGSLNLNGGTISIAHGEMAALQHVTQRRGSISGLGTLVINGTYAWGGGASSGSGTTVIASHAAATFFGIGTKLLGRTISNHGELTQIGGILKFGPSTPGTISNFGSIVVGGDTAWVVGGVTGHEINNHGTFVVESGGALSLGDGVSLNNFGNVVVEPDGRLTTAGIYVQVAGLTLLSNGTLDGNMAMIEGGTLAGTGSVNATLVNDGLVEVGGAGTVGTLRIDGDYVQRSSGMLKIELAGALPELVDQLVLTGVAYLDGVFQVALIDGYAPSVGDSFTVLEFGSRMGEFNSYLGLNLGNGLELDPVFHPDNLTLITKAS